jgi:hypothetical protein
LAITLVDAVPTGLTKHRWKINRTAVEFAMTFGGFSFLLFLQTAVGDDIYRNWGAQGRVVAWNPYRIWKIFIHQLARITAKKCF